MIGWSRKTKVYIICKTERLSDKKEMSTTRNYPGTREGRVGKLMTLLAELSCKLVYKMLGPQFIQLPSVLVLLLVLSNGCLSPSTPHF